MWIVEKVQSMSGYHREGGAPPASPNPMSIPAWVYDGSFGLLYTIHVLVICAPPGASLSPAQATLGLRLSWLGAFARSFRIV